MNHHLEIHPRELKFVVEANKQSKCSIRVVNKTDQCVAFKVKTTSPKMYCVRPNVVGIVQRKETCEFIVIMQALKEVPADLTCKDKFLIQSTVVVFDEKLENKTFARDNERYIKEMKMRVILSNPPSHSSVILSTPPPHSSAALSPVNDKVPIGEGEQRRLLKEVEEIKRKLHELELKVNKTEVTTSKLTEEIRLGTQERESLQQEMTTLRKRKLMKRAQDKFPLLFAW